MHDDQRPVGQNKPDRKKDAQEQIQTNENVWICPKCKTKNYALQCGICGTYRSQKEVCVCGHQNPENSKYCSACGKRLGKRRRPGKVLRIITAIFAVLLVVGFFTCHIWTEVTCEEPSKCLICGKVRTAALNHRYGGWKVTAEPSCETAGERINTCTKCGHIDKQTIPADGHLRGTWTKTKAPTCTVPGTEVVRCTNCQKTLETRSIPALGHDYANGTCKRCMQKDPTILSGQSGSTKWILSEKGVLTISGKGAMADYGFAGKHPWTAHISKIKSVVVEKGVTVIGSGAFKGLTKLESVHLPESGLKKIGEAAFYGCSSLKKISIPDSIYTIQDYTFKGCTAMESLHLSKNLLKIGKGAFENCSALTYAFIPGEVNIIDTWSFKGCSALVEVDMTWANATEIRENAFKNCSRLKKIALPAGIRILGDSAFYGIGATTFTVPDTVTKIGAWCFARASLQKIVFTGNAPAIGQGAFNKVTLTAIYDCTKPSWKAEVMQNYGGNVTWKTN